MLYKRIQRLLRVRIGKMKRRQARLERFTSDTLTNWTDVKRIADADSTRTYRN